tara:strand:+ start:42 stop:944 length:903 start_codon:yes stop_codon:yes gene_type:complete
MGLLSQTQAQYYNSIDPNYGDYQFVSLENIINSFLFAYVGEDKIIKKASRIDVQFHAMRAAQELSYDVLRSFKTQEIEVPNTLTMILPQDYVNYVKLSRVDSNGIERVLYPTGKTCNPFAISQDADGDYQYNLESTVMFGQQPTTLLEQTPSDSLSNYQNQSSTSDAYSDDTTDMEIDSRGRRYGLDPQFAQANGSFYIDYARGKIHFSSSLAGQTIVLKYVSDGLGTDEEMVIHKFCEEACYKWIAFGILSTRSNIPPFIIQRFKKERFAETRKAKIRLSNIKIEEFTQVLKGLSKPIK